MHARLGLRPAMRVMALDEQRAGFDPGLVAKSFFDELDLEFVPLGPARIHAKEHARPVAALGAAGPCMDFNISVVAIDLAREQRLDLTALGFGLEVAEFGEAFFFRARVALAFG